MRNGTSTATINRRSLLIACATGGIVAVTGSTFIFRSVVADTKDALYYTYGLYEYAHRMQILSAQVKRDGLVSEKDVLEQFPDWQGEPILNKGIHVRSLSDHSSRSIPTPNSDTLYTSAVLELSGGPVEVNLPASQDRYISVAFMDAFSEQVAYLGTRATRGKPGRYWVFGPGQKAQTPEGVEAIVMTTNDIWALARVFVAGDDDLEAARAVQSQLTIAPVDPKNKPKTFAVKATPTPNPQTFLALTNELLSRSPLQGQAARASRFEHLGVSAGRLDAYDRLSPLKKKLWELALENVEGQVREQMMQLEGATVGWIKPPRDLGNYRENDALRSAVAIVGFGALTLEEAAYYKSTGDNAGDPLHGANIYRMEIPQNAIPVDAFWSLSVYEVSSDQRLYFFENPINRFSVNSHDSGLEFQEDGTLVLALQNERPDEEGVVWFPTPKSQFQCVFRAYLPHKEAVEGQWTPPPITRVL
ncbi:MAG: DUF1254 domain-containing protein [Pseudomonadota bacterium]